MHDNFDHIDELGYEVITYNTGHSIIGRFVDTLVEENNDQFPDQCVIIFRVLAIGQFWGGTQQNNDQSNSRTFPHWEPAEDFVV